MIALRSALVGLGGLGGVGTSNSLAGRLAGNITSIAVEDAADLRGKTGRGGGSAGDGSGILGQGEDAGSESEDGNGVLHGDFVLDDRYGERFGSTGTKRRDAVLIK